jgi:3D (Asp-Asp-Asp) domain-containing protein
VTKRMIAFALFSALAIASQSASALGSEELSPVDTSSMISLGTLGPSFYWIALEKKTSEPRDQKVLDESGNLITTVALSFYKNLKLEGTARLLDGRVLNFKSVVTNPDGTREVRYQVCPKSAPYGYGLGDRKLEAFRSVAIDPSVVPMDSMLYIPAARGAKLPDGTIHDGMFRAVDIGSAIIDRRIDVFTSFGDQSAVFDKNGLIHGKQTEVFLVK